MLETPPARILLPEVSNAVVAELHENNTTGLNLLFEKRTLQEALDLLNEGAVDAVIIGADEVSADVIRAGKKILGKVDADGVISSFFIMEKKGEPPKYFADCAVNPSPDQEKLVHIAEQTCANVRRLGSNPVVAFLSFSTDGSAGHCTEVQVVKAAADAFRLAHPEITTYGEIQFDAACDEQIYEKKTGQRFHDGKPNVFIFPDLNSGNITYKALEQLAGYVAVGPILQGFRRPLYDLSRGVSLPALTRICQVAAQLHLVER